MMYIFLRLKFRKPNKRRAEYRGVRIGRRGEVEETKIETNGIWRGSIRATTPEGTQTFMSDGNRNYTATFFCKSNAVKLELDSIEGDLTLSVRGIKDRA